MLWNSKEVEHNGKVFVFVRKGNAEVTQEFINEYFSSMENKKKQCKMSVPDNKMFAQDLRSGLNFCAQKYGVDRETVLSEAKKRFPHLNMNLVDD